MSDIIIRLFIQPLSWSTRRITTRNFDDQRWKTYIKRIRHICLQPIESTVPLESDFCSCEKWAGKLTISMVWLWKISLSIRHGYRTWKRTEYGKSVTNLLSMFDSLFKEQTFCLTSSFLSIEMRTKGNLILYDANISVEARIDYDKLLTMFVSIIDH